MTREVLAESIQHLPAEFSIDELIERLLILEKIEKARQQYRDGNTLTNEEAKERLSKWLK
jgi:hypothetical protein